MPHIKHYSVKCKRNKCPQFDDCPEIKTELKFRNPHDDRIHILFVGEAGGVVEEKYGIPFCGPSGTLLQRIIDYIESKLGHRINYALSNVARCHPIKEVDTDKDGNPIYEDRKPNKKEIKNCLPYLLRDLKKINPKYIVTLGQLPYKALTGQDRPVSLIHGALEKVTIQGKEYKLVGTFHPAHALRAPDIIGIIINDMLRPFGVLPFHSIPKGEYRIVKTVKGVRKLVDRILALPEDAYVVVDTEAPNLNRVYNTSLDIIQFCWDGKIGWIVPVMHRETPFTASELKEVKKELQRLFTAKCRFRYWLMHNAKFDLTKIWNELNVLVRNRPVICTMTARFLLDENFLALSADVGGRVGSYGLKPVSRLYGFRGFEEEARAIAARESGTLTTMPLKEIAPYCAMDVYVPWHLWRITLEEAQQQKYKKKMLRLLKYFYSDSYLLLAVIETNGIPVDKKRLQKLLSKRSPLRKRIAELEDEFSSFKTVKRANEILVKEGAGGMQPIFADPWVFDINKEDHKRTLFFDVMHIKPVSHTKVTGIPGVDKAFVKAYSDTYAEVEMLASHKAAKQLLGLYVKSISKYLDPEKGLDDCRDGRVRPQFSLTGTKTGRASAKQPNSQQTVNAKDDLAQMVRGIWYSPDKVLCKLDYMANEVRGWGIFSKDPVLTKSFLNSKAYRDEYRRNPTPENKANAKTLGDIHRMNASSMFSVPPDKVTDAQRQDIKPLTFGPIYGRGVPAMAVQMKRSNEYVQEKLDLFFKKFKVGKKWLDGQVDFVKRFYYVESLIGQRRRLYAHMIADKRRDYDYQVVHAENQAKNSPIQGMMSHCAFIGAFLFLTEFIIPNGLEDEWKLMNVVHDSAEAEIPPGDVYAYAVESEPYFTTRVGEYLEEKFGVVTEIPLEVEYEFGFRLSEKDMEKWDFSRQHLWDIQTRLVKENAKRVQRLHKIDEQPFDYAIV